ncbi:unnamed protein product [Notodromas monacha]|uniref:Uncharacterized protein n=1 Tax=Notodromas monacha TaxID=399045 RepID=A0A7R9BJP4_9CRUS|nr:unnamed protein product [Notodromas monacha]CAG0915224.1 unnamed protein product [Notodromas monacha]
MEEKLRLVDLSLGVGLSKQGNLTGIERRLKDSVADVHNCIGKWNQQNARGTSVLMDLGNFLLSRQPVGDIKTVAQFQQVAPEIRKRLTELSAIVDKMEALSDKMTMIASQMEALRDLELSQSTSVCGDGSPQIFFYSWPVQSFVDAFRKVASAYEAELPTKRRVVSSVAHGSDRDALLLHVSVWGYDGSLSGEVRTLVDAMLYETGHYSL